MGFLLILYYSASGLLWLGLTVVAVAVGRAHFPEWLQAHPKTMLRLLGTDQLPKNPGRTLRRFYWFLYGGFTWLLVWSWWLMPWARHYFYASIVSETTAHIAYYSTLGVYVLYAAVGFLGIARSMAIWFKEIYGPTRFPFSK